MTRNLKALGLALVAVFAMSAVAAQGASAVTQHHFTSEVNETFLTGEGHAGNQIFSTPGFAVECKKLTLSGKLAEKTTEVLTLSYAYSDCTFKGAPITIHNEGCRTVFHATTTTNPANTTAGESAAVDIECDHTGRTTITTPGCTIEIRDTHAGVLVNQGIHGVKYKNANTTGKTELTGEKHLFGVRTRTFDNPATPNGCLLIGKTNGGTSSNLTTLGNFTLKGYEDAAHTKQVGISLTTT